MSIKAIADELRVLGETDLADQVDQVVAKKGRSIPREFQNLGLDQFETHTCERVINQMMKTLKSVVDDVEDDLKDLFSKEASSRPHKSHNKTPLRQAILKFIEHEGIE